MPLAPPGEHAALAAAPAAAGARGFTRGSIFTRDGAMVASTAQEGLLRLAAGKPAGRAM